MHAILLWVFAFAFLMFGGFALWGSWGMAFALALWVVVVVYTFQFFVVWSPATDAVITIDAFQKDADRKGKLRVYPSGLHFKRITEMPAGENISLEFRTEPFTVTCPTNDATMATITGSFQWRPKNEARHLERFLFVRKDTKNILLGVTNEVEHLLSKEIRKMPILTAEKSVEELSVLVDEHFNKVRDLGDKSARSLEEEFGIDVTTPTVATISGDEKFKSARSTKRAMNEIRTIARQAVSDAAGKDQVLEFGVAMDNALLVLQGGKVNKQTIKHEVAAGSLGDQLLSYISMFAGNNEKPIDHKGGKK